MNERADMDCQEFEIFGLDSSRDQSLGSDVRQRAAHHLRICAKCRALRTSWKTAEVELAALSESTQSVGVPSRVETRVLQHFRLRHQSRRERKTSRLASWSLAAAAILLCTAGIWDWQKWRQGSTPVEPAAVHDANTISAAGDDGRAVARASPETLVAENENGDFTRLPGSFSEETEDGTIVRVGMQRASLGALGFPVNEERAGEWIQVDLLVASDGSPQAVRLPE